MNEIFKLDTIYYRINYYVIFKNSKALVWGVLFKSVIYNSLLKKKCLLNK